VLGLVTLGLLLHLALPLARGDEAHSGFPVEVRAGTTPSPISVASRTHLVYEIHLTSFVPWGIELSSLEIRGDAQAQPLARYGAGDLETRVVPAERLFGSSAAKPGSGTSRSLGEGHAAIVFVDLDLGVGARAPSTLRHTLTFSYTNDAGARVEKTIEGVPVRVLGDPPPVLKPPLRGPAWVAFNAFGVLDHRRAVVSVDGRLAIGQRFAIDWAALGPDGRLFRKDGKANADYYGYRAEALAVSDGRVVEAVDRFPDNAGHTERSSRTITLENVLGNHVCLDLGGGRYALYAHLQPGSLRVKVGDEVKAGAVLGLLGNSGNSDAPHLHFQITDGPSPLGDEGIPYEIDAFTEIGTVGDQDAALDRGEALRPQGGPKVPHSRDFPSAGAVVALP
jgi:hypothetical protein